MLLKKGDKMNGIPDELEIKETVNRSKMAIRYVCGCVASGLVGEFDKQPVQLSLCALHSEVINTKDKQYKLPIML